VNRGELEQAIIDYMKRPDLVNVTNLFVIQATARIGRLLRSRHNEIWETGVDIQGGVYQLPAKFVELRRVERNGPGGVQVLRSLNNEAAARVSRGDGAPIGYQLAAGRLYLKPPGAGSFNLGYWVEPADLTAAGSENPVLTAYPSLYLYASLIEGYTYIRDWEMVQGMTQIAATEVQQINQSEKRARLGATPAMGAA